MRSNARFQGHVAIVTGAGSGIGLATASLLSREGAKVLLVDINQDAIESAKTQIRAKGGIAESAVGDVGVETDVQRAVEGALSFWGRINLLVNDAASFVQKGVDASVEEWYKPWKTNVLGPALFTRTAYPAMRDAGGGAIVNVASTSGMTGDPNYATYNSSKAALLVLTMCAAVDLGPYDIRVNAVSPGVTITPALRAAIERDGSTYEEFERTWPDKQCLKRFCRPEDIANAIAFLLSDDARCISGTNLVVDVGFMAKK
jgi:NAD(P)-dependent dehydrogenase (short-subunit alcohol dehydrogenase family)